MPRTAEKQREWRKKNPEANKAINQKADAKQHITGQMEARVGLHKILHPDKKKRARKGLYIDDIIKRRNPITVKDDFVFLTSDFHIPFHDIGLLDTLCDMGKDHGKPKLLVAGDYLDCDSYYLMARDIGVVNTFETELEHGATVLKQIRQCFSEITFCRGNHEDRWIKLNGARTTLKMLFKLMDIGDRGYQVTEDTSIGLVQKGEKWIVGHPKAYSQVPLTVARRIAEKHHCHTALGHSHIMAHGYDISGKFQVCDLGGLFDQSQLDYQRHLTKHPKNKSGFYILDENKLFPVEGK